VAPTPAVVPPTPAVVSPSPSVVTPPVVVPPAVPTAVAPPFVLPPATAAPTSPPTTAAPTAPENYVDAFNAPCYPHQCSYGLPWPKASDGKVYIAYSFDNSVGSAARAVFKDAANDYVKEGTCVRFHESDSHPRININAKDTSCAATVGYPGDSAESTMWIGGCSNMAARGSVVHELGHVLGMGHEQQRLDGIGKVNGHGPFIRVAWQNIDPAWQVEYQPRDSLYMGSDGKYSQYDYGSIMHYSSGGDKIYATDPAFQSIMGQRNGLSLSDVEQIKDMYECR